MANILETSMDYLAQFDPEIASQMQSEYQFNEFSRDSSGPQSASVLRTIQGVVV